MTAPFLSNLIVLIIQQESKSKVSNQNAITLKDAKFNAVVHMSAPIIKVDSAHDMFTTEFDPADPNTMQVGTKSGLLNITTHR